VSFAADGFARIRRGGALQSTERPLTVMAAVKRYTLRADPRREGAQFRIAYAEELNPQQLEAATTLDGPILVVAGAGSGKTRTLVYRVARLVESGVPPGAILLLTFTRKAAAEMLRRAGGLVGGSCAQVAGGTFHSFAHLTLRRHGEAVGLSSGFTILDRSDSEDVINLLRSEAGLDRKERRFPRKQALATIYSMAVNCQSTVVDLVTEEYPHLFEQLDAIVALQARYVEFKARRQLVDYDDLLVKLRDALAEPALAARLGRQYRYVMVDEYQDTNALQADIVRRLASTHDNVMVVGDDAQSIYAFRGADVRNIMEFPGLFPGTRVITLDQNYRSTQPILDLANAVINRAPEKYTKNLFTMRGQGERPALVQARDEPEQSHFIAQRILELREEGVPLSEIAVLFRSSFHAFDLEIALSRRNIPFVKRGGFRFVESAHVKDVLAHLRVVANSEDAVSWHRILLLIEGIGPKSSQDLLARIAGVPRPWEALAAAPGRGKTACDVQRLAHLLTEVAAAATPGEQLGRILTYYGPVLRRLHPADYPKRERDLEQFAAIAERYRSTTSLLADMALEPPTDSVAGVLAGDGEDEGMVTLSTVHSAKGLEWHTVFVLWAADGRFPSMYGVQDDADIEEERRLMYVAVTRAKDRLYLTYPIEIYDRGLGLIMAKPSRFVEGLSDDLLEPIALVDEAID
jgi:DNA helicase-2/ATP-dependent DNA helicase PcrA